MAVIKRVLFSVLVFSVILQGLYIYNIKDKSASIIKAHAHVKVINALSEVQKKINNDKGSEQAIRELIIRKAVEEIKLKKLINDHSFEMPGYARKIFEKPIIKANDHS